MATIGETIDLHAPLTVARQKWDEYVYGMIIGSRAGPGERGQDAEETQRLRADLRGGLDLFRRYAEGRLHKAA